MTQNDSVVLLLSVNKVVFVSLLRCLPNLWNLWPRDSWRGWSLWSCWASSGCTVCFTWWTPVEVKLNKQIINNTELNNTCAHFTLCLPADFRNTMNRRFPSVLEGEQMFILHCRPVPLNLGLIPTFNSIMQIQIS